MATLAFQACAHTPADSPAYRTGASESAAEPQGCTEDRGFELGAAGEAYPDACPAAAHPQVVRAFDAGRQYMALQAGILELEQDLAIRHEDLLDIKSTAYELEAMLYSAAPAMDRWLRVLLELRELARQETEVEQEIERLAAERDLQQQLLASLEIVVSRS